MIELELFQMYHLREMSLSAELFLSCSILQFTFYAISTAYQRKAGFVILNKQVYYIGTLLIVLSSFDSEYNSTTNGNESATIVRGTLILS